MEEAKFKVGDRITRKPCCGGLEKAEVTRVENGKYYLKIVRGTAVLPISAQVNYKLQDTEL